MNRYLNGTALSVIVPAETPAVSLTGYPGDSDVMMPWRDARMALFELPAPTMQAPPPATRVPPPLDYVTSDGIFVDSKTVDPLASCFVSAKPRLTAMGYAMMQAAFATQALVSAARKAKS